MNRKTCVEMGKIKQGLRRKVRDQRLSGADEKQEVRDFLRVEEKQEVRGFLGKMK